jgi:hydroxyacylglutathione hydrolase
VRSRIAEGANLGLIDVRRPDEYARGHVPGAVNANLAHLEEKAGEFDRSKPTAVVCASGYRSSTATSVLARRGFREVFNVVGGTSAWMNAHYPTEQVDSRN